MSFIQVPAIESSSETPLAGRRGILRGMGMVGIGCLAGTGSALAAPFGMDGTPKVSAPTRAPQPVRHDVLRPAAGMDVRDLPEQWVRDQGAALPQYYRYLSALNLRSIDPREVIDAHAKSKGGVWNCLPPQKWWKRMGYTLRVADRIALEMNVSQVEVVSGFRQPAYNARCPGAKSRSWHQANVAVDVKFPVKASKVTATARNLRDRGLFRGGIGGYWNFTHIDTRGENVNW